LRVAIDGIDTAGKTTLANELVPLIEAQGRPVIRASIDSFHNPRNKRYQQGPDSPSGYYQDAFDYTTLKTDLLRPLGPGGNRHYQEAIFDYRTETPLAHPAKLTSANAILLVDGVFLLRPELISHWDYRIYLHIDFATALQRALQRDQQLFGNAEAVEARYNQRYFPAQLLYFQQANPQQQADLIIDNTDPAFPHIQ
jgi:uridine kinase